MCGPAPVATAGSVGREIPVRREKRRRAGPIVVGAGLPAARPPAAPRGRAAAARVSPGPPGDTDRKSTRLNSSHITISYAVFCLKKKKNRDLTLTLHRFAEHPVRVTAGKLTV